MFIISSVPCISFQGFSIVRCAAPVLHMGDQLNHVVKATYMPLALALLPSLLMMKKTWMMDG